MIEFKLQGGEEALRNLEMIEEAVTDENLRADALETLQPVVDDARYLAPVNEGDLRDSIRAIVLEDGSAAVVIENWKGHFFEFGTVKMRAQPMLIPAWEANRSELGNSFGKRVGVRIESPARNRTRAGLKFEGL